MFIYHWIIFKYKNDGMRTHPWIFEGFGLILCFASTYLLNGTSKGGFLSSSEELNLAIKDALIKKNWFEIKFFIMRIILASRNACTPNLSNAKPRI